MTCVHLDTCFLIRSLVPGSPEDRSLRGWLEARVPIAVSLIAWAEFLCGPVSKSDLEIARLVVGRPVPLTEADAESAAGLFNGSGRRRGSFLDCLIAAVAIRMGTVLATSNAQDFRGFVEAGLEIADVAKTGPVVQ